MTKPINILSTKKLLSNQKHDLLNANINLIEEDFIETKSKNFELNQVHENLIFTSQNAVQSVLDHPKCNELKNKNAFCVGIKTKELLTKNGFNVIAYTGYAADLAEIISLIYNQESYTFFSGNLRRDVLPNTLKENKIILNEIKVYETHLTPKKINEKVDGILFFSPSGVESYLKLNTIQNEMCFCIGKTTAEKIKSYHISKIVLPKEPNIQKLIQQVINFYE